MVQDREITPDDIASVTRGLGLGMLHKRELEKKIKERSYSELFASRVIIQACREQLAARYGKVVKI